ncbi:MAG: response regulator [Bacteroidota bacterium]
MSNTINVFLVEDDEIFAFLVQNRMGQVAGVELQVFEMGQPCLDALDQNPDVIFLDYSLPYMDGLEVLKKIKEKAPEMRVVMLSGMEWQTVVDECMAAGAEDFIQKDAQVANKVYEKLSAMFPQIA